MTHVGHIRSYRERRRICPGDASRGQVGAGDHANIMAIRTWHRANIMTTQTCHRGNIMTTGTAATKGQRSRSSTAHKKNYPTQ